MAHATQEHAPSIEDLLQKAGVSVPENARIIIPTPGFVVKTREKNGGRKIFANVCGAPELAAPDQHVFGGAPQQPRDPGEKLRLPMSVSAPREDADKAGKPCLVFDAVFNRDFVDKVMKERDMKLFLGEVTTSWIAAKHEMELEEDFKVLSLSYKGELPVPPHFVRKEPSNHIQEVGTNKEGDLPPHDDPRKTRSTIFIELHAKDEAHCTFQVFLPSGSTAQDVSVRVDGRRLRVSAGTCAPSSIAVPAAFVEDADPTIELVYGKNPEQLFVKVSGKQRPQKTDAEHAFCRSDIDRLKDELRMMAFDPELLLSP